ncbi:NACHT, LRR and PYD domains-containing protein 8, partial [Sigmodon hispidus]
VKENQLLFCWWQEICSVFETHKDLKVLSMKFSVLKGPFMQIFTTALKQPRCKLQRL